MIHWSGKSRYELYAIDKENFEAEEWRQLDEFPNYWVSNKGRMWNRKTDKLVGHSESGSHGHNGKSYKYKKQYQYVTLYNSGVKRHIEVHRVMGFVFLGEVYELLHKAMPNVRWEIDHIDGDGSNNDIENLRWIHPKYNMMRRDYAKKNKV